MILVPVQAFDVLSFLVLRIPASITTAIHFDLG